MPHKLAWVKPCRGEGRCLMDSQGGASPAPSGTGCRRANERTKEKNPAGISHPTEGLSPSNAGSRLHRPATPAATKRLRRPSQRPQVKLPPLVPLLPKTLLFGRAKAVAERGRPACGASRQPLHSLLPFPGAARFSVLPRRWAGCPPAPVTPKAVTGLEKAQSRAMPTVDAQTPWWPSSAPSHKLQSSPTFSFIFFF